MLSPKITYEIPMRNVELCRDRIAEIILAELDYQYQSDYNPYAQIGNVYIERTNPTDFVEMSCVNVSLDTDNFSNKAYGGSKTAIATINVDVFVKSETTESERGDSTSRIKCTRLLSIIDYILDDPQYKTLAFSPGFINTVAVESIGMADPERYDTQNITHGRLTYSITVTENNSLLDGEVLQESFTKAYIGDTNKGLRYEYST